MADDLWVRINDEQVRIYREHWAVTCHRLKADDEVYICTSVIPRKLNVEICHADKDGSYCRCCIDALDSVTLDSVTVYDFHHKNSHRIWLRPDSLLADKIAATDDMRYLVIDWKKFQQLTGVRLSI